jgi:hypothetical protein
MNCKRLAGPGRITQDTGVSKRWRTLETEAGTVLVEEIGPDSFRVYGGRRFPGDEPIGSFGVDGAEHGIPWWTWWAGDDVASDQGGAASENDAVIAILRFTTSRAGS